MDGVNCTSCGKQLLEGDWVSKSGLCRACAEGKLDKKNMKKYFLFAVCSVLLMVVTLTIAITQAGNSTGSVLGEDGKPTDEALTRFTIIAHSAVKDNLKAPKTAEFDLSKEVWYMFEDGVYGISGSVTSENAFGVPLTGDYFVKFKCWGLDYDENEVLKVEIE